MSEARTAKGKIRQGQKESVRPLIPAARIQKRIRAMAKEIRRDFPEERLHLVSVLKGGVFFLTDLARRDRKSTRLNSSHRTISYAVFCLKKKNRNKVQP